MYNIFYFVNNRSTRDILLPQTLNISYPLKTPTCLVGAFIIYTALCLLPPEAHDQCMIANMISA